MFGYLAEYEFGLMAGSKRRINCHLQPELQTLLDISV